MTGEGEDFSPKETESSYEKCEYCVPSISAVTLKARLTTTK